MLLPSRTSGKAFTMLELIIVIVILGILAVLAVPTFQKVIARSQDSSAEATLQSVAREVAALSALSSDGKVPDLASEGLQDDLPGFTVSTNQSENDRQISYAVSSDRTKVGLAARSKSDNCVFATADVSGMTTSWRGSSGSCAADEALNGPKDDGDGAPASTVSVQSLSIELQQLCNTLTAAVQADPNYAASIDNVENSYGYVPPAGMRVYAAAQNGFAYAFGDLVGVNDEGTGSQADELYCSYDPTGKVSDLAPSSVPVSVPADWAGVARDSGADGTQNLAPVAQVSGLKGSSSARDVDTRLAWSAVSDAESYELQVDDGSGWMTYPLGSVTSQGDLVLAEVATPGKLVLNSYQVRAVRADGKAGPWSEATRVVSTGGAATQYALSGYGIGKPQFQFTAQNWPANSPVTGVASCELYVYEGDHTGSMFAANGMVRHEFQAAAGGRECAFDLATGASPVQFEAGKSYTFWFYATYAVTGNDVNTADSGTKTVFSAPARYTFTYSG